MRTRPMRYRLCTLLILLAVGPPILSTAFKAYDYCRQLKRERFLKSLDEVAVTLQELDLPEEPPMFFPWSGK